ncbi:MAG TPA: TIM barrel protein [Terriglobia bacterium]|jgi:sugar phosphate isomerase/epimerase|nr:TIM barrel protein [Terriglobia bacterium]
MKSRRQFLGVIGAGLAGAVAPVKETLAAQQLRPFRGPFGLELYSLRHQIKTGDAASVKAAMSYAKKVGYTEIEVPDLSGLSAREYRSLLDEVGLPCTSMMAGYDQFSTELRTVAANAHTLGAAHVVNAWIPHKGPFTIELCRETAKLYNEWGKKLHADGLRFAHHTHGYEFQPHLGRPLFDTLVEETNPEYVDFEMDIFWVVDPGEDPVAYLKKYPNRWRLMHLKDMKKGPPTRNFTGDEPVNWDVALGTGRMDMPAILAEAERVGVKRFYVEDESDQAHKQVVEDLRFLKTVRI